MFVKSFQLSGLLALFISVSLLSSLVSASPVPDPAAAAERRTPGCPSVKVLPSKNKLFYGTLTRPEIATFDGGYYGFVKDYYTDNFTITDTTANYPTWIEGKRRPVLGTWAKSGTQFAKGLTENLPKIREIFDIEVNGNVVTSGGEGTKCKETTAKATFTAKLKKNFGGRKAGFTFKFTYRHTLAVRWVNGGFQIDRVDMKTDWSQFFRN